MAIFVGVTALLTTPVAGQFVASDCLIDRKALIYKALLGVWGVGGVTPIAPRDSP